MKVESRGKNVTVIETDTAEILVSYSTPVAAILDGTHAVKTAQFHSVTTSRHVKKFLDGREAEEAPQDFFDHLLD